MAGITQAERERRDRLYERGLKQCNTCDEPLSLDSYSLRADGYRGLNGTCKACKNAAAADYQLRTPERQADRQKRWRDETGINGSVSPVAGTYVSGGAGRG
jgi:hypothetical protein